MALLRVSAIAVGTIMAATATFDCSQHSRLTYISMSSKEIMLEPGIRSPSIHSHGSFTSSRDLPAEAGKPYASRIVQTRSRHRFGCNSYRAISTFR